jgi:hypothetical protein
MRFGSQVMSPLAKGIQPAVIVNAVETAFMIHHQGLRHGHGGTKAVQIPVAGNEKQPCSATAVATMDGRKLPLCPAVQGKLGRAARGLELETPGPRVSTRNPTRMDDGG